MQISEYSRNYTWGDVLNLGMVAAVVLGLILWCGAPSHDGRRICANETSAVAALKQLVSTESMWRQTDSDGNGIQDYWTLDVAGVYAMQDASGTILKFIDVNFAKADAKPKVSFRGQPPAPQAKSMYLFCAMAWDETGASYPANPVPGKTGVLGSTGAVTLACHPSKFAFCAIPGVYNQGGTRTFIVNEQGVIYGVDSGSNAPVLRWPGTDPTACTVKGRFWSVVQ